MAMGSSNNQLLDEDKKDDAPSDDRLLVKWLEAKESSLQTKLTKQKLKDYLGDAAQPRHASGNACIKLCYFIEQCRKSTSHNIREIASSSTSCLDLFNFYIEWNEKNQNRSMRQILELIASLIALNSQKSVSLAVKESILTRITLIIGHQDSQPLAKPAFKSLECFLSKGTITPEDIVEIYEKRSNSQSGSSGVIPGMNGLARWDSLISEIFGWLTLPDVSPAAGKCLVTLFCQLRVTTQGSADAAGDYALLWQRWIRDGLARNPDTLENVKNYLFHPLFKLDRPGSLAFLEDLNNQKPISDLKDQTLSAHSLLQLAAIEVGKKAGLIEEPNTIYFQSPSKKTSACIILRENVIGPLLANATDSVRSLAFSVLVSSSSTIRPFNVEALNYLRSGMSLLYADTDAKFRNEVLSNTKHMIERMRGATAYLVREFQSSSFVKGQVEENGLVPARKRMKEVENVLRIHEDFLQWFLVFLLGELIPTASYQRHITALKAIISLLRSGILSQDQRSIVPPPADNSTMWPFTIMFFTTGAMRLLLDLVLDPFEDVRINAASILRLAPRHCFQIGRPVGYVESIRSFVRTLNSKPHLATPVPHSGTSYSSLYASGDKDSLGMLKEFIIKAEDVSKRTGRADYADGLARGYSLLFRLLPTTSSRIDLVDQLIADLETRTSMARMDISRAVSDSPVHGTFAALSFVWESIDLGVDCGESKSDDEESNRRQWDNFQLRILHCCSSIWLSVKDVLCNDSPEGHLPEDLDEVPSIDTKDVLSYSFRAVHESSNLMKTIINRIKDRWPNGSGILPKEIYIGVGHLTFEQLSNLRHRGAFSTVSLTFARCCQLAQHQDPDDSPNVTIIQRWYKGAMACIIEQTSTTRRSAGIPALITGILSSNASSPSFEEVLRELVLLSQQHIKLSDRDQTNLPQVHAMNCLKEIFKSSTLGRRAEAHTAECLQLAADSLNSEIWAIRNCGLLLLRSLIDSLFGTSESKSVTEAGWDGRSIRLSYERYPTLPDLLVKLLDTDTSRSGYYASPVVGAVESVFPALDIIRRAGPPSSHRDEIYRCVSMHLGSKLWHVREIAARTICTLLLHQNWLQDVLSLIARCEESANCLHGTLMATKFILERRLLLDQPSSINGLVDIEAAFQTPNVQASLHQAVPEIQAAYLEIYNIFAKIILATPASPENGSEALIRAFIQKPLTNHRFEMHLLENNPNSITMATALALVSDINATLGNAIVRRAVYVSAIKNNLEMLQVILKSIMELNTDIILTTIKCVSQAWGQNHSPASLAGLAKAYLDLTAASTSPDISTAAMGHLLETIDQQLLLVNQSSVSELSNLDDMRASAADTSISRLQEPLKGLRDTPSLSNARIGISGAICLFNELGHSASDEPSKLDRSYLESWGSLLASAGDPNNDFDTRHTAAVALATFYGNGNLCGPSFNDKYCLLPLFALYDSLNDDDDEIRDLSAATASKLLKKSLVPLAASVELAKWMHSCHYNSAPYAWNVVQRMTGHTTFEVSAEAEPSIASAEIHLGKVMEDDDSLFVEEEQNLFIDEVRETRLWCDIFVGSSSNRREDSGIEQTWIKPNAALAAWVLHGLKTMNKLLEKEDGSLGWISKPAVFAICMRVVLSAYAIIYRRNRLCFENGERELSKDTDIENIITCLDEFVKLGHVRAIHERLLFEAEGNTMEAAT